MPLSIAQAQAALGLVIGSGTPAHVYIALMLTSPTPAGGGSEVTGTGYARVSVANTNVQWSGPSATAPSVSSNVNAIVFPTAGSDWGQPAFFAIYDAATFGNLIWFGPLANPIDIPSGTTPQYAASNLNLTLG